MTIPKKKYRDKVRARLAVTKSVFDKPDRIFELLRRNGHGTRAEARSKADAIIRFLNVDVPALLDAFDDREPECHGQETSAGI